MGFLGVRGVRYKWKYVVATSGPFRTAGGFLLARIPPGEDYRGPLDRSKLKDGFLQTNGEDDTGGKALRLGVGTEIVGQARSVGGAEAEEILRSKIFENVKPEKLPTINLQDYNPRGRIEPVVLASGHYTESKSVAGYASYTGSLKFDQGLKLNGGLLYVEGDVVIEGGISGTGALVCTGSVQVKGGSDLSAAQSTAILAGGDVRLVGSGRDSSYFQGLVYAGGRGGIPGQDPDLDLQVSNITLLGALLSNGSGSDGKGGSSEVTNASMIYDPKGVQLTFDVNLTAVESTYGTVQTTGPKLVPGRSAIQSFWDEGTQSYRTPDPANPGAWDGILTYTVETQDGSTRTFTSYAEASANASAQARSRLGRQVRLMISRIVEEVGAAQNAYTNQHSVTTVNLDLNKFLQEKDRLRLLYEAESITTAERVASQ